MNILKSITALAIFIIATTSCTKNIDVIETNTTIEETGLNIEIDERSVISGNAVAFYCDQDTVNFNIKTVVVTNAEVFEDFQGNFLSDDFNIDLYRDDLREGDFMFLNLSYFDELTQMPSLDLSVFLANVDIGDGLQLYSSDVNIDEIDVEISSLNEEVISGTFAGELFNENDEPIGSFFSGEFYTEEIRLDKCIE